MADAHWPADALEVGRIADAWGVKGSFRVQPYAADAAALMKARVWHLQAAESPLPLPLPGQAASSLPATLVITATRAHGEGLVATAREIDDRRAAESLRGARIFLGRSTFPAIDPDEFYWADLIGLAVVNRDGVPLGAVAGLLDNGPHSVLRIQPAGDGEETLVPFVAAYVDDVDLAARRITVDWGLDY